LGERCRFAGKSLNNLGGGYTNGFYAREFWRFVLVQQEFFKLAETEINYPPMQKPAGTSAVSRRCIFFGQPKKCEIAHTSLPIRPSKVRHSDIYLAPGGVHGTETKTS
jgi:hypothetical protein